MSDIVEGHIKWFDATKGFGFVVDDLGGPDILLHANVLRNFGRGSITEGARVTLRAQTTQRGLQAVELLSVDQPDVPPSGDAETLAGIPEAGDAPLVPARVKWFDKSKGFGFANVFGDQADVFIHVEVLRRSGLAEVQPGEAIALRVVEGPRGKMAAEVHAWAAA